MASPHQDPHRLRCWNLSGPHEFHFFVSDSCFYFCGLWFGSSHASYVFWFDSFWLVLKAQCVSIWFPCLPYVESSIAAWQTFRVLSDFLSFTKSTLNESTMTFGDCISTQFVLTSQYLFYQLSDWHIASFVPFVLYKLINMFLNCSKITDEN